MKTEDGEVVIGAPHRAAHDDGRVCRVEDFGERFVVFVARDVDVEQRRRHVHTFVVDDDDCRGRPSRRDESGWNRVRDESDFRNDFRGATTENFESERFCNIFCRLT